MTKAFPPCRFLIPAACLASLLAFTAQSQAQTTYFYQNDNTGSGNWTATNAWDTAPDGSGTNVTLSSSNSNIYNTNAKAVRTPTTAGITFPGGSLILSGHSTEAAGANYSLMLTSNTVTIANLSTQAFSEANNFVLIRPTVPNLTTLTSTNFSVGVETRFHFQTSIPRSLNFAITNLTGSGDMHMGLDGKGSSTLGSTLALSATNASAYTGDIIVYGGTSMDFNSTFTSGGGLQLLTGAILTLDQNLSFTSATIGGTALSAGTYTFANLNSAYDAYFANGGSGSITVLSSIPEPSATVALLGAAALSFACRRRHASRV